MADKNGADMVRPPEEKRSAAQGKRFVAIEVLKGEDWFIRWFEQLPAKAQAKLQNDLQGWVDKRWFHEADADRSRLLRIIVEHVWLKRALVPPAPGTEGSVAQPSQGITERDAATVRLGRRPALTSDPTKSR